MVFINILFVSIFVFYQDETQVSFVYLASMVFNFKIHDLFHTWILNFIPWFANEVVWFVDKCILLLYTNYVMEKKIQLINDLCHKYCSKIWLAHSICPFIWGWNVKHNFIFTHHNSNNLLPHLLKLMFTFENNILRFSALTSSAFLHSMYVFLPIAWRISSKIFRKVYK